MRIYHREVRQTIVRTIWQTLELPDGSSIDDADAVPLTESEKLRLFSSTPSTTIKVGGAAFKKSIRNPQKP